MRRLRVHFTAARLLGASGLVFVASVGLGAGASPAGATTGTSPLSGGYLQTCAVTATSAVECWGYNGDGELGDGTYTTSNVPVTVVGLRATQVTTGGWYTTCAVTTAGTAACWGANDEGELGDGLTTTVQPKSDVPVTVTGLTHVRSVSVGGTAACALLSTGTVECWGNGSDGQLGDGSTADSSVPVPVTGLSNVTAISVGDYSACALETSGRVYCWGDDERGQLGDGHFGTPTLSDAPVQVQGLTGATAISVGYFTACALRATGTVDCWGDNAWGQLGNGLFSTPTTTTTVGTSDVPVQVHTLAGVTAIAVGGIQNCALTSGGIVECWGWGEYGELGNGSFRPSGLPVTVIGLSDPVAIAPGFYQMCAATATGAVSCWGDNYYGELGDGYTETTTTSAVPVRALTVLVAPVVSTTSACPLGTRSCASSVSRPGKSVSVSNGAAKVTVTGRGSVSLGSYRSDPVGKSPGGNATFFALSITPAGAAKSIVVQVCNVSPGTTLEWWDGSSWLTVAGGPGSTSPGCVSFTLTATSSPTIATIARMSRQSRFGALVFAAVAG